MGKHGNKKSMPRLAGPVMVMAVFMGAGLLAGAPVVERSVAALDQPWVRSMLSGPVSVLGDASRLLGLYDLQLSLHQSWTDALGGGGGTSPGASYLADTAKAGNLSSPANKGVLTDAAGQADPGGRTDSASQAGQIGPGRPLRLLVIGDSQAMGPDFAFKRDVGKDGWYVYQGEYRLSSTLANPGVYDWLSRLDAWLDAGFQDALIVYLGSNDAQAVKDGEGQAEFASPEWTGIMKSRIRAFMARACEGAARVYWVACPPMRDQGFNRKIQIINQVYRECALEFPRVKWMEFRDLLYSDSGGYVQGRMVNGRQVELRKEDGIHLSRTGYEYVCARLLELIEADFGFTRPRPVYPIFGETLSGL